MTLGPGVQLGPYSIESALGAGGMGEVYRARDTRLDRVVAIKVLSPTLAGDGQFRERFDREARAISQLAHPHICTLYDVGEHHGTPFLVMELLEGESLESRLTSGALPVAQALKIAIDVAAALDAAHRANIVHRDLKPGNIFLVRGASASAPPTAKLLDFGLAKSRAPASPVSGLTAAPTTPPMSMTAAGTILGTLQYMAPEQIDGVESDARTDLFAFGCVLFEMLTGRKAFEGKTRASLLGAILKDEPPPASQLTPGVPAPVDRLVQTCLAKDPDDRWQTARDVLRELKWVAQQASGLGTQAAGLGPQASGLRTLASVAPTRGWRALVGAALGAAALAGVATWTLTQQPPAERPVVRLQVQPPVAAPLFIDGIAPDLAISPDGSHIAFVTGRGASQLYVQRLDQGEATPLTGTPAGVRGPFFSPDSQWIAYFQVGDLMKVSVGGGTPISICTGCATGNRGGSWGENDTIVFAPAGGTGGLRRIPASGGELTEVTTVDGTQGETAHMWPELLPGGQSVLFTVFSGAVDDPSIVAQDLKTGARSMLVRKGTQPRMVGNERLAYALAGGIFAIGFDPVRLTTIGTPVPAGARVVMKPVGAADYGVSREGTLVYISGESPTGSARLAWIDRQAREEPIAAPPRAYLYPRLSPDGSRIALHVADGDIWIWDVARQALAQMTTDPSQDGFPVWSPDGTRIAFSSNRAGGQNIYWQRVDGTGSAERLNESKMIQVPWAFTRDGRSLIMRDSTTSLDIALLPLDGPRVVKPLVHSPVNELNAELSPDGRWLAYQSADSARTNVYVRPFPDVDQGHWLVSTEGGSRPLWSRDGRELFFVDLKTRLMSVRLDPGPSFQAGNPTVVLDLTVITPIGAPGRYYDVSPDGKRFLFIRNAELPDGNTDPPRLNVVLNWPTDLQRLVPLPR